MDLRMVLAGDIIAPKDSKAVRQLVALNMLINVSGLVAHVSQRRR